MPDNPITQDCQESLVAYHYCWRRHTTYSDFWLCLHQGLQAAVNRKYSPCHTCPDFWHRLNLKDKGPVVEQYIQAKHLQIARAHRAHEYNRVAPAHEEVTL